MSDVSAGDAGRGPDRCAHGRGQITTGLLRVAGRANGRAGAERRIKHGCRNQQAEPKHTLDTNSNGYSNQAAFRASNLYTGAQTDLPRYSTVPVLFKDLHPKIGVDYQHKIHETRSMGFLKRETLDQLAARYRRIQTQRVSDEDRTVDCRERLAATKEENSDE